MKRFTRLLITGSISLLIPVTAWCQTPSGQTPSGQTPSGQTPSVQTPPGQTPRGLTLEQAFARALEANPSMGSAQAAIAVADAQRRGFLSAILPKLTLNGRVTRNTEEAAFGEGPDRRDILPRDDWDYQVKLSQPIYAGNRERRAYEQAKIQVDTERHRLVATREGLLLRVVVDFLGVVQGDALLTVEEQGVALAQDLVEQAKSFRAAGEVTEVEVKRAEVGLKAAERRLAAARRQRGTAASLLRLDLALDAESETGIRADELVVVAPDPALLAKPLPPIDELMQGALDRRPEMKTARNDYAVSKLDVRKQRGAYLPVVTLDAFYKEQESSFPSNSYGSASINFTLPLWDSGATAARVRAASELETRARLELEATEQRVRDEIRRALLDVESAETSLVLAREQAASAEAEFNQTFDLYQAQEATALDVRQAETSLADARRAIVESSLDLDLSRASVWYFAGSLARTVLGDDGL